MAGPDQDEIRKYPFGTDVVGGAATAQAGTSHVDNCRSRQLPVRPMFLPMALRTHQILGPFRTMQGLPGSKRRIDIREDQWPADLDFHRQKTLRDGTEKLSHLGRHLGQGFAVDHLAVTAEAARRIGAFGLLAGPALRRIARQPPCWALLKRPINPPSADLCT